MKMKLILAITMLMLSVGTMSAKGVDKQNKELVRDSARIEYLNEDVELTHLVWSMETNAETNESKYYVTLGSTRYRVSKDSLIKACIGKREHSNYYVVSNKTGRKLEFKFDEFVSQYQF